MWPTTLMVLGVIMAPLMFFTVGENTFITYNTLFRWFILFALVGNLVPSRWCAAALKMDRKEWFLFSLLAIGPFLFSTGLLVNRMFHGPPEYIVVEQGGWVDPMRYWREQGEMLPNRPWQGKTWPGDGAEISWEDLEALSALRPGDALYAVADGVLGYRVKIRGAVFPVNGSLVPVSEE